MSDQSTVEVRLSDEALALFKAYQGYTGTSPGDYIGSLVDKTLPTLKALVESFEEVGQNGEEAVMELFGRKMAEAMLQQQEQQKQES
ncbi:MAG: hypothetical protein V7707_17260 [Motiliproteus sp.]